MWESILKMGSLGESKMWEIKRGHSVTGGLKMGVNVAAHTSHIFLGSAPRATFLDGGGKGPVAPPLFRLGDGPSTFLTVIVSHHAVDNYAVLTA